MASLYTCKVIELCLGKALTLYSEQFQLHDKSDQYEILAIVSLKPLLRAAAYGQSLYM